MVAKIPSTRTDLSILILISIDADFETCANIQLLQEVQNKRDIFNVRSIELPLETPVPKRSLTLPTPAITAKKPRLLPRTPSDNFPTNSPQVLRRSARIAKKTPTVWDFKLPSSSPVEKSPINSSPIERNTINSDSTDCHTIDDPSIPIDDNPALDSDEALEGDDDLLCDYNPDLDLTSTDNKSEEETNEEDLDRLAANDLLLSNAKQIVTIPYTDSNGFIRIGQQPLPPSTFISSCSSSIAGEFARRQVKMCFAHTDKHLAGSKATKKDLESEQADILFCFWLRAIGLDSRRVVVLCDYTGQPLSMSPSFDHRSPSVEALYPVVKVGAIHRLGYHAVPNVCRASAVLNWAKGQHSILVLPLIAEWIRVDSSAIGFEQKRRRLSWIFNAIMNISLLTRAYQIVGPHSKKIEIWQEWPIETQIAASEALRTGIRSPASDLPLQDMEQDTLTPQLAKKVSERMPLCQDTIDSFYSTAVGVAQDHGLFEHEFRFYLTLPSDDRSPPFFPFHVLCRPQAQAAGFDWRSILAYCQVAKSRMDDFCNRNAEKAGLIEPGLDKETFMFWLVAYFSDKIAKLKSSKPRASPEELQFHITDDFGLPMTPWILNPFSMSIGKVDHGVAMRTGLEIQSPAQGDFDIDLTKCSIQTDSWFTNKAKFNFSSSDWPEIKNLLMHVPLSHPFYRIPASLGSKLWYGAWDQRLTPLAPNLELTIPLVPID